MAEFQFKYKDIEDRKAKILEAESQGLRMLHDDFDPDWKPGDEPHGTMTFTDEPAPVVTSEPARDLAAEVDQIKADVKAIKTKLNIKTQ